MFGLIHVPPWGKHVPIRAVRIVNLLLRRLAPRILYNASCSPVCATSMVPQRMGLTVTLLGPKSSLMRLYLRMSTETNSRAAIASVSFFITCTFELHNVMAKG